MAEQGNGHPAHEGEPQPPVAAVVISYGLGESVPTVSTQGNITPGQIYLAAMVLDMVAREHRAGVLAKEAYGGLVADPATLFKMMQGVGRG